MYLLKTVSDLEFVNAEIVQNIDQRSVRIKKLTVKSEELTQTKASNEKMIKKLNLIME